MLEQPTVEPTKAEVPASSPIVASDEDGLISYPPELAGRTVAELAASPELRQRLLEAEQTLE
jgi:hypothetical protein